MPALHSPGDIKIDDDDEDEADHPTQLWTLNMELMEQLTCSTCGISRQVKFLASTESLSARAGHVGLEQRSSESCKWKGITTALERKEQAHIAASGGQHRQSALNDQWCG